MRTNFRSLTPQFATYHSYVRVGPKDKEDVPPKKVNPKRIVLSDKAQEAVLAFVESIKQRKANGEPTVMLKPHKFRPKEEEE